MGTYGPVSSAPYVADYAKAPTPMGPISADIFITIDEPSNWFGPTSSNEYQVGTQGAGGLRGPQFAQNTIANDRFTNPLLSVISITPDIDLTATGLTTIYTVPEGKTVLVSGVLLNITENLSFTAIPTVSIDAASPVFAAESLAGVMGKHDIWVFWHDKSTTTQITTGDISTNVTVAATATTLRATAFLIGLLL